MRNLCPFTKDALCCEDCALWLKDLERCSFKEIAMQMNGIRGELEHCRINIGSIPHKIKIPPHKIKIKT